jgi:hypothetical protein
MKFKLILFLFLLSTICYSQNYVSIGVSTTNSNNQLKQDFYPSIEIGRNFRSSSIGLVLGRNNLDFSNSFQPYFYELKVAGYQPIGFYTMGLSWRKDVDTDPQFHNIIKHVKNNL